MRSTPRHPPHPLLLAAIVRLLGAALGLALACQVVAGLTAAPAPTDTAAGAAVTFSIPGSAGGFALAIQP